MEHWNAVPEISAGGWKDKAEGGWGEAEVGVWCVLLQGASLVGQHLHLPPRSVNVKCSVLHLGWGEVGKQEILEVQ